MQGCIWRKPAVILLTAMLFLLPLFAYTPSAHAASDWSIQNGALSAQGGNSGLLGFGYNWTDYTMTFSTEITANQSGWIVRDQSANNNYLLILDANNDTVGPQNALQQVVSNGSNSYVSLTSVTLAQTLLPNTWHTVKTVVQGTTVTTYLDNSLVASFNSTSFPSGTPSYANGTVGFRESTGEAALYQNLQVTDTSGTILYQNALSQSANLNDFFVPGSSATPLPWPSNPDWQQYVQAPASRDVHPVAVISTAGSVTNAAALTQPGSGQTATLSWSGSGTAPAIILDYGKEVGGLPQFTVSAESGSPTLQSGYSEVQQYISPTGDGGTPWGSGDAQRYDSYSVMQAGTIVNRYVQGGERYQEITLTSAGSVTLSAVEIYYEPYQGTPNTYQGYFVTDNTLLNRIWYDGAYTLNQIQMQPNTTSGAWNVQNSALNIQGGNAALLASGSNWTDYTMAFSTEINSAQAGWVVRGQSPNNNYLLILDADNDTGGTANSLQQLVATGPGTYTALATVTLPFDLQPNTWHSVKTVVQGTTVTTSIDNQQIASFNSTSFPSGTPTYANGTIGFREYGSEAASFQNLKVVDSSNNVLYQNALSQQSALNDFTVPGNSLPLILDGAKRDRAVWEGDLSVAGPTVYYSSNATDYIKDSLELLGSYQLQSGFVTGALSPNTALNTSGLLPGQTTTYSASYSMYWVTNLADYYLYTGDSSFINQEWSAIASELAWNAQQVNSQGLFVTDSNDGDDWHYYDGAQIGAIASFNMLYYQTLKAGAVLATAAGHADQATTYQAQANTLKNAINQYLFNTTTGAYNISTTQTGAVPQDANALAVLYSVAPSSQANGILSSMTQNLKSPYGELDVSQPSSNGGYTQLISPFISSYDLWARFQSGDTTDAMNLLTNEWGHMATTTTGPSGTDWEQMAVDGTIGGGNVSAEHGWSTGSTTALSEYVLGVSPVQPGYQSWQIKPQPGTQPWAEGQVPTPHGTIAVQWGQNAVSQQFELQAQVPASTSGTIAIPIANAQATVVVNNSTVWSSGSFHATTGISAGSSDGKYVYLTAAGGTTYLATSH